MISRTCTLAILLIWVAGLQITSAMQPHSLAEELKRIPLAELADLARTDGDAARGAAVFFQPHMACSKCHSMGEAEPSTLGPDLAMLGKDVTDAMLVQSVLDPSAVISKGFQSVTVVTTDGRTVAGLLVERTLGQVVVRDGSTGTLITLPAADIDEVVDNPLSLMPTDQVNQLGSRQQFLDLMRYLMEVRDGGPARARELQPSPTLLALTIPAYEQHLDHAAFIGGWDDETLKRGEAIYQRVCANCHGTHEQAGSLPTSIRFAEGKFKNGSDPLAMYRTLTYGFGQMVPQTWMVPSQKYDVIHYIREKYLRSYNPSQFVSIDASYLDRLPPGNTRGPEPSKIERWSAMDYGPSLTHTYEIPDESHNFAYKGIAIRLDPGGGGVSRGRQWMIFDTDTLRVAAAWQSDKHGENFIDWRGIQFNGEHQIHPRIVGTITCANSTGPGWADPATESFADDQRTEGRDGRRYGPLPRQWARFRGMYHHGQQVVLSYTVGNTEVLELPRLSNSADEHGSPAVLRTFNVGPRDRDLVLQVAEHSNSRSPLLVGFAPSDVPATWTMEQGRLRLRIAAGEQPLAFTVWTTPAPQTGISQIARDEATAEESIIVASNAALAPKMVDADLDLATLTGGGPMRWQEKLVTTAVIGDENNPFVVDVLTAPESNPWLAQTLLTGLDFFPSGSIAVCSWDGDVWLVAMEPQNTSLRWQRIASGLFQPLGLKIIDNKIHVICRDQLAVLHDLNGDGEIDFYECLNNDHQVTEHFHEFAMGLQTDAEGNFYYAKSGRHALPAVVPHHGTLLRVSRDGSRTEILATGFRATNGVCLNPDGSFVVTDQEGFWNPKNRINWVTLDPSGTPKFYGNMFGYTDVTDPSDDAMEPPLCWITNDFDRSPAELLWVESDSWGPLQGSLLNLSYGYGKVFVVPHERVGGMMQGGMIQLPLPPLATGVMRGRFHPGDGQLYLCGMFAWAGNATHPGELYRLRTTGQAMHLPIALHATKSGLQLRFTEPLDPAAVDTERLQVKTWSLRRTAGYGSKHHDEKTLGVRAATLSADGKTLTIDVADLQPTWSMEINYSLRAASGEAVVGVIHNTIHQLAD
jgi:putative heme-binding domain-containing protein